MSSEGSRCAVGEPRQASLPLYRLPELDRAKTDFWGALSTELRRAGERDLPDGLDLTRPVVPASIGADTLLTQVCGYPLVKRFFSQVRLLAAPVYDADPYGGPRHRGVFVVRQDSPYTGLQDLRDSRFVFGGPLSNSGMNLPRRAIADLAGGAPFFASAVESDSQSENVESVAHGRADATCVDVMTYAYMARYRPNATAELRILATTRWSPSIPFVTSTATHPQNADRLKVALRAVATSPRWEAVRAALMLRDIVPVDVADYASLLNHELEAVALGYPVLC